MPDEMKARADARLDAALKEGGVRDPRGPCRTALKRLRERDPGAFSDAIRYFEQELVPAVAGDADPLGAWLAYARRIAEALGRGRTVQIGPSGRAHPLDDPPPTSTLILHLPDDETLPALVLRYPRPSTSAQDATVELLVQGRVTASAYDAR